MLGGGVDNPLHNAAFAASGSYEVLVDHDGDPNTPPVREFAGADRYETSLAAARRYVETYSATRPRPNAFGLRMPHVILSSGDSLIDAAAAAGLTRELESEEYGFQLPSKAPETIVLVPSDRLPSSVANFIEESALKSIERSSIFFNFQVRVLGGPAAVSDTVLASVRNLLSQLDFGDKAFEVSRISGANRFDTAVQIDKSGTSEERAFYFGDGNFNLGRSYGYCSIPDTLADLKGNGVENSAAIDGYTAVLVAGDSETLADITIAGPFSYAMRTPILLTSTTGLPEETISALKGTINPEFPEFFASGLDPFKHVVIIGGSYSIPDIDALEEQLRAAGVEVVTRLGGDNPAETSVTVAKELERCLPSTSSDIELYRPHTVYSLHSFDPSSVALISETALADGISASPILGQGLAATDRDTYRRVTPALLVGSDNLPDAVRDYLREKENPVMIYTIGGEAAISSEVVEAAVAAANGEN